MRERRWMSWFAAMILGLSLVGLAGPSNQAISAPKTLIDYQGGKVSPGLASAAKSMGPGKYQFTLGSHNIKGQALTPAMVKSSLESKLAKKGVSVEAQGANAVVVSFKGDEATFLTEVSKTRIKSGGSSLAVESTVSDGGIRARIPARQAKPDEIEAKFMGQNGDQIMVVVVKPGQTGLAAKVKKGQPLTVGGRGKFTAKKKDQFFFTPKTDKPWTGTNFTFE